MRVVRKSPVESPIYCTMQAKHILSQELAAGKQTSGSIRKTLFRKEYIAIYKCVCVCVCMCVCVCLNLFLHVYLFYNDIIPLLF
jgi:hypothetical protein